MNDGQQQPPDLEREQPRWTISKRTRMDNENLHVSSFVLVKNMPEDSIALLRGGPKHPIQFRRGKLLLPSAILNFGENPKRVAQRLLGEQIIGAENVKVDFASMQSYRGAHWDIVFLFEAKIGQEAKTLMMKDPFTEVGFYRMSALPRGQIAEDHLEVLDELEKESAEEPREH